MAPKAGESDLLGAQLGELYLSAKHLLFSRTPVGKRERKVKRKDSQTAGQLKDSEKSPAKREEPKNRTAQGTQGP